MDSTKTPSNDHLRVQLFPQNQQESVTNPIATSPFKVPQDISPKTPKKDDLPSPIPEKSPKLVNTPEKTSQSTFDLLTLPDKQDFDHIPKEIIPSPIEEKIIEKPTVLETKKNSTSLNNSRIQLKTPEKRTTIKPKEFTTPKSQKSLILDSSPLTEGTPFNQNDKRIREKEMEMKEPKKLKTSLEEKYESLVKEFLTESKIEPELEKKLIEMRIDGDKKNEEMTLMIEKMTEYQEELQKMTVDLLVDNTRLLTLFDREFDERIEEIMKLYK